MKKLTILSGLLVMLFSGIHGAADTLVAYSSGKRHYCEGTCKQRYYSCRQRAYAKEKYRQKTLGICNTFFMDCMNRCRRYR